VSEKTFAEVTRELTGPGSPLEIEIITIRGVSTRSWKTLPQTVPKILKHLESFAERDYIVYEGERLTYAQTLERVRALAAYLQEVCNIQKGDRIALAMRNYPEWIIAFWASLSIGAIIVPLNAWWKSQELGYGLRDSGSRVLICDEERARLIDAELANSPVEHVLVARGAGPRSFEDAVSSYLGRTSLSVEIDADDDATIFYTSGTTGQPKGALGTHRNLCANIGSTMFARARALARGTRSSLPPTMQASGLLSVPLFHVTGCHSALVAASFSGNKLVMIHKWNPEQALELIERERLTQFGGVPSMAWQVLESPDFKKRDTSSVASISYGGAPAASELVKRIKEAFPNVTASNGYGLTETSALAISNIGVDYVRKPDSVGVPVAANEVKIVGEDGTELPVGSVGELWIKGPNVVKGYWGKPEATAQAFTDGWLHTGDIAKFDDEGFVYILDRAKDMLIRGGENIYCVEVENVLHDHPAVLDVAVVGLAHEQLGEVPAAVVQLRPGVAVGDTTETLLRAHARTQLASFKVPAQLRLTYESLPRNAAGKLQKRELRSWFDEPAP
jgi:long-chain acyl-CoA synthetase